MFVRFLNIRLDQIEVMDPARHPHMVRTVHFVRRSPSDCRILDVAVFDIDGGKELLYPWVCGAVCSASIGARRYAIIGGRHTTRYVPRYLFVQHHHIFYNLFFAMNDTYFWCWLCRIR